MENKVQVEHYEQVRRATLQRMDSVMNATNAVSDIINARADGLTLYEAADIMRLCIAAQRAMQRIHKILAPEL